MSFFCPYSVLHFWRIQLFFCVKLNRERESRKERERRNDRESRYEKKEERGKRENVETIEEVGMKKKRERK